MEINNAWLMEQNGNLVLTGWGFAATGNAAFRSPCDTGETNSEQKLCWPTEVGYIGAGGRCGTTQGMNSANWERVIMHHD